MINGKIISLFYFYTVKYSILPVAGYNYRLGTGRSWVRSSDLRKLLYHPSQTRDDMGFLRADDMAK